MKQFKSFQEASSYKLNCIFCNEKLSINERDLIDDHPDGDGISFYLSNLNDDVVTINRLTDEVAYTPPSYIKDGTFIHGLTFHCDECCQYAYTIQIHIALAPKKIIGLFLNSESLSVEDGEDLHEIKNAYSLEQTEYTCFKNLTYEIVPENQISSKVSGDQTIILPLIPLNLENPMETVKRIRNLIIFT